MDELDLTEEELQLLQEEGLVPPGWQPGMPLEEGALAYGQGDEEMGALAAVDDEGMVDDEAEFETGLVAGEPDTRVAPGTEVESGIELLSQFEQASPAVRNPMIQRFGDIALRWLPTDDKELKDARRLAQDSADQLAALRLAAEQQAQRYPWEEFAAAMFAPKVSYGFPAAMSLAMKATSAEKQRREKVARDLALAESQANLTRSGQIQRSEMERVRTGADLAQAAARMQASERAFNKQMQAGGAFGKKMADLGIDITTPEGMKAARRMYVLEQAKSNPAALTVLLGNPDMDPFSPEFSEALAAEQLRLLQKKEGEEAAKSKRREAIDASLEASRAANVEESKARTKAILKKLDEAEGTGKPLPTTAANKIFENQQSLRRAERALAMIEGKTVGGMKGDPAATGWKGYIWDPVLQRMDPKGAPTRAAIADLGSIIIHERSGAAVTASEYPRLAPFIPKATDDPKVVKQKVQRFLQEYRLIQAELAEFYHEAGYRVPTNALKGIVDIPGTEGANEVRRRDPKSGRNAVFDANTKKFLRWE